MSTSTRKWLIGAAAASTALVVSAVVAAQWMTRRFDPYIRAQAVEYLRARFDCDVSIDRLTVNIPRVPWLLLIRTRGNGVLASVTGEGVTLRQRNSPLQITMRSFQFEVDLGHVFDPVKRVSHVRLEQVEIRVPSLTPQHLADARPPPVEFDQIELTNSRLFILSRDLKRKPLEFALHHVVLVATGAGQPFSYRAKLTIATPPGIVEASGAFGPWKTTAPADTTLDGVYTFRNANLAVFPAITGTLTSTGSFRGTLKALETKGEADVPDFRLRSGGSTPMVLHTSFEALVDGTNGDTILKPVRARLGTSAFTTSGAIVLPPAGAGARAIDLDVDMADGEMLELLQMAVPVKPFLSGRLQMKARIHIPPSTASVNDKLVLDGRFHVQRGQFLDPNVQEKIDSLSRRGQGQPKNRTIGNVFSDMAGDFHLEHQTIDFRTLSFGVPGSRVDLSGRYAIPSDTLDFHGALRLDAHVSQTTTGWKRWLLKVADPFFARHGAGTFLRIKVQGSSKDPHFGPEF